MPDNATVFIVEDHGLMRSIACEYLEDAGHQIAAQAGTLKDALAQVPNLHELGVNVVILDANLTENTDTGADGQQVFDAIKGQHPDLKVILWSLKTTYPYGDVKVRKQTTMDELLKAISQA